jgi:hypothetical protein
MASALSTHFRTLGRVVFNAPAIFVIVSPASKRHKIWARCTSRAGDPREWLNRANSSFCSGLRISLGRPDLPAMIQYSGKQI